VFDACVVATDSVEVADACRAFGAPVELTRSDHPSGTDRVAEVAARAAYADFHVIVNLQGDEPFIREEHVAAAAALVADGWDVGTVATPVRTLEAWRDPAVVKVLRADNGRALAFTRAAVPHKRSGEPTTAELASPPFLRHVGVYACARAALTRWVALPPAELELLERLEQLRPLAAGMRIGVALGAHAEGGVDTPEDARRAEARLGPIHPADAHPTVER
jgi:3-deoxy-manno-octulosonate cytidylyltransferase (CMP-KDO synthetase)